MMAGHSRAEIWQADFGGSRGHEQKKERPCIIWRDLDHLGMAVVMPLTGSLERDNLQYTLRLEPTTQNGLEKESIVLVFQITAIDKCRLIKKLGVLDDADLSAIRVLLKDLLRV
jgi:mRNA interferase MazF